MSSDKAGEISSLIEKVAKADQEFGSGLLQIAENLLLHKITRGSDLDSISGMIQKGKSASNLGGENKSDYGTKLARNFSASVAMLEGMDPQGLSDMIKLLRETASPEPVQEEAHPPQVTPPVVEEMPHVISCLKQPRLQPMQKVIYDKFGTDAPKRLYSAGELYGTRIVLEFKNLGLGIEKTIREIERIVKLAGWGEFSFHRVDPRKVECTIVNTIFSYKRDEARNSCYFASGIVGGMIHAMLQKVGQFVARETECVSDGSGHCKFEIVASEAEAKF